MKKKLVAVFLSLLTSASVFSSALPAYAEESTVTTEAEQSETPTGDESEGSTEEESESEQQDSSTTVETEDSSGSGQASEKTTVSEEEETETPETSNDQKETDAQQDEPAENDANPTGETSEETGDSSTGADSETADSENAGSTETGTTDSDTEAQPEEKATADGTEDAEEEITYDPTAAENGVDENMLGVSLFSLSTTQSNSAIVFNEVSCADTVKLGDTLNVSANISSTNGLYSIVAEFTDTDAISDNSEYGNAVYFTLTGSGDGIYSGSKVISGVSVGDHTLRITARDNLGQVTKYEKTIHVTADVEDHDAPVVSDISFTPNVVKLGDSVTISAKIEDPSGIDRVTFSLNGQTIYFPKEDPEGSNIYTVKINSFSGAMVGDDTLYVMARDKQGNITADKQYSCKFTVEGNDDKTGPVLSNMEFPSAVKEGDIIEIRCDASDESGIDAVWCNLYDASRDSLMNDNSDGRVMELNLHPNEKENGKYTASIRVAGLVPGECTATFTAVDKYSNFTSAADNSTFKFTVSGSVLSDSGVTLSTPDEDNNASIKVTDVNGNDLSNLATPVSSYVAEKTGATEGNIIRGLDIVYYINGQAAVKSNGTYVVDIPMSQDDYYKYSSIYVLYIDQNTDIPVEMFNTQYIYERGVLEFTTTHLSRYVLYGVTATKNPSNTDSGITNNTNATSNTSSSSSSSSSSSAESTPVPAPVINSVDVYRLLNPANGDHFYTVSTAERDALVEAGWTLEGVSWKAPEWSNTPVYRLLGADGTHYFTTDAAEKDALTAQGWTYEGIGWYSADASGIPIYQNSFGAVHNYTASTEEKDALTAAGWTDDSIAWYGSRS